MRQAGVDEREELLLEQLAAVAAAEARLLAQRADLLVESAALSAQLRGADGIDRYLELDVAATLRTGQQAAGLRLAEARRLHTTLTRTLTGLRTAAVLVPQALLLLQETRRCSEPVAADAERRVFTGLGTDGLAPWTGGRLRRRIKRCVLAAEAALEPDQTAQRETCARQQRRVSVRPEPDAMASLWALLPADQARAFTLGLDELTRRQRAADRATGLHRTADQCRADLLALLPALALHALDGTTPTPDGSHPAVVVDVHVPMATALGLSDAPGHLTGYGPISAGTVRLMLPHARLRKVVVDATTGEPVHVSARTVRPSTAGGRVAALRPRHGRGPDQAVGDPAGRRADPVERPGEPVETPAPLDGSAPAGTAPAGRRADPVERPGEPVETPAPLDGSAPAGTAPAGRPEVLPDGPLRRALLAMLDDQPLLVQDAPEPQYAPSAGLDRLVRTRDPHCTGIGCDQPAGLCDLDHRNPWPVGPTSAGNLATLSRRCHHAKTRSWSLQRSSDGSTTWTSPTRRRYRTPSPWDPPPDLHGHRPRPLPADAPPSAPRVVADEQDRGLTRCLAPPAVDEVSCGSVTRTGGDPPPF